MTCRKRCAECPLPDRKIVPGRGKRGGLMIIGEAPGSMDANKSKPFPAESHSGKLLRETAKQVGLNIYTAYSTFVVACHVPYVAGKKTKPSTKMIQTCSAGLLQEIIDVQPTKILTLGAVPLKALFGQDARISKVRGLGQYVDIPVTYKEVEHIKYKPVWVEAKYIDDPVVLHGQEMVIAGEHKGETIYLDPADLTPPKELKSGKRFKMFKRETTTVLEPDQMRSIFTVATYAPGQIYDSPDMFREFALDLEKIARQDAPLPAPRIDTWIVRDADEAEEALEMIRQANVLGCDTETTGLDPHTAELLSIGFGALVDNHPDCDGVAVIIPREIVYDQRVFDAVQCILDGSQHKGTLVFHNIKFDLQILHHAGYSIMHPHQTHADLMDTMMMAYHWDERPSLPDEQGEAGGGKPQGRSLKTLARVLYDIPDYHFDFELFYHKLEHGSLSEADWTLLYTYHGIDCVLTARLYYDMKARLEEDSPKLYPLAKNVSVPACMTFAAVEYRGIKVDVPYLQDLRVTYQAKKDGYYTVLDEAWRGTMEQTEPLNPGSSVQVMKLLQGHKIHVESTQRDPLLHWKATTEKDDPRRALVDNLINYRLYTMMINTFIDGMLKRVDKNGRLHTEYDVGGTATGRLSSKNPNLQNIPSRMGAEIRHAFIASDGMVLVNADYSQVQVRIAASKLFANDASMREAYVNRDDIYKVVASKMYHIPKDQITKKQRQYAKTIVLGTLFEQTSHGILEGREMAMMKDAGEEVWTKEEAEFFQSEFFREFPGFKDYMERQHAFGKEYRYVEDPLGRRRRFPFIAPGMLGHFQRQTGNSPIQAGEAEIVLTGANRLHRHFMSHTPQQAFIVLSVHDSIMSEVYPEHVQSISTSIVDILENDPPFFSDIPFRVDVEAGNRWSELVPVEEWEHTINA